MDFKYFILLFISFSFASQVSIEMFTINNLWILIATILVFIMHLGFATLESGLTRSKNTVNILFKIEKCVRIRTGEDGEDAIG